MYLMMDWKEIVGNVEEREEEEVPSLWQMDNPLVLTPVYDYEDDYYYLPDAVSYFPNLHPISLFLVTHVQNQYPATRTIHYEKSRISGYILHDTVLVNVDQQHDTDQYVDMDWTKIDNQQTAEMWMGVIHDKLVQSGHSLDQHPWWNVHYLAFYKTLELLATISHVSRKRLVWVMCKYNMDKQYSFMDIRHVKLRKELCDMIHRHIEMWCVPRRTTHYNPYVVGDIPL